MPDPLKLGGNGHDVLEGQVSVQCVTQKQEGYIIVPGPPELSLQSLLPFAR